MESKIFFYDTKITIAYFKIQTCTVTVVVIYLFLSLHINSLLLYVSLSDTPVYIISHFEKRRKCHRYMSFVMSKIHEII